MEQIGENRTTVKRLAIGVPKSFLALFWWLGGFIMFMVGSLVLWGKVVTVTVDALNGGVSDRIVGSVIVWSTFFWWVTTLFGGVVLWLLAMQGKNLFPKVWRFLSIVPDRSKDK